MDEKEKKAITSEKPTSTEENTGRGDKPQTQDLLERARAEREGLMKENDRLEKNIAELKSIETSRLLGGGDTGGNVAPTAPKKPDPKEYAKAVMRGEVPE